MIRQNINRKNKKINKLIIIGTIVMIIILIGTITTVKAVITQIAAKEGKALIKHENTDTVQWVDSTERDSEGNVIQVPVPKGFTASQVEGETTVNGGFVIYEGDIDWSTIIVNQTNEIANNTKIDSLEVKEDNKVTEKLNKESKLEKQQENVTYNEQNTETKLEQNVQENTINDDFKKVNEETKVEENITLQELAETMAAEESTETITPEEQTAINVFKLQKEVNQYVWVPVSDVSRIYGVDSNGKYWGKLYDFPDDGTRTAYVNGWTEKDGIMTINSKEADREPDTVANMSNYDIDSILQVWLKGKTRYEFQRELEENFYKTIRSIEKYGGFYIARYEMGFHDTEKKAIIRKMANNLTADAWYDFYDVCKNLREENNNVITSMIWGSLWDETLQWFIDSKATNSKGVPLTNSLIKKDSTSWGNYKPSEFMYIAEDSQTPTPTEKKASGTSKRIKTGSSDYTKINNIYDMSGNASEFVIETYQTDLRCMRMGDYNRTTSAFKTATRNLLSVKYNNYNCRAMLLIK